MIRKILLSLKTKAVGNDNIGRIMLSYLIDYIVPSLAHIINFSFDTGTFPTEWRKAHIIPLPKVSNPSQPNEFRPISILPYMSKVIETVVHKQITAYLSNADLFNHLQSGFRVAHSTTTALLKVTEDIREAMEISKVTALVLIDFSNAFNAVDHNLLLAVLSHLNFSSEATSWFSSYLQERQQQIRHDQEYSDWTNVETGVPQGAILSPLLFSLFINLLCPFIKCSYHFYADDLQLYCSSSTEDINVAINQLNSDLLQLLSWSNSYGIKVNPNKCQAILIGSSRQLTKLNVSLLSPLVFDNCPIPFSPSVKDLGVIIDSNLSWKPHVDEISRKFYASLHSILRLKHFLPTKTKISLVNTLLLPIIFYADACLVDASEGILNKIDRLLNTCIRFIFNLKKYDHVSEYRTKLKWLPIRERRNIRILCLLFSILTDPISPRYLKEKFKFLTDTHNRDLRSSQNLNLTTPHHKTSFLHKSFAVVGVQLWNDLPENIRKSKNKFQFKRLVHQHYLKIVYPK